MRFKKSLERQHRTPANARPQEISDIVTMKLNTITRGSKVV